jgi:hypothetical protein
VLVYEKDDVVLLVPFAEGCATSLPRKIEAESEPTPPTPPITGRAPPPMSNSCRASMPGFGPK